MTNLKVTPALRAAIERHYGLREPICNADARAEYRLFVRKLARLDGPLTPALESLRAIFIAHGCADPLVQVERHVARRSFWQGEPK